MHCVYFVVFKYHCCSNFYVIQGIDNESDAAMAMVSDNTAKLTSAVNSLPQLLEKKRLIDMHTTIATGLLSLIYHLINTSCQILK